MATTCTTTSVTVQKPFHRCQRANPSKPRRRSIIGMRAMSSNCNSTA
ncbi:MAG: hypothetical protein M3066_17715 [Actinomycetota bacterium]|nr:hypothetical protein [Actinomycetota bacterium]